MKIEDILNMKIEPGIHQWDGTDKDGMTCGSLEIVLPNGCVVQITSTVHESGRVMSQVDIHNLNDTDITVFSKVKKYIRRSMGSIWTKISGVEA